MNISLEDTIDAMGSSDFGVTELKKMIIHQLTSSKDLNMRYKLRIDFMHNRNSDNYVKMMENRTGLSSLDLYLNASKFIRDINRWIYDELCKLDKKELADLMNDPIEMDKFLSRVHRRIGEDNNDVFLQKCDKRIY